MPGSEKIILFVNQSAPGPSSETFDVDNPTEAVTVYAENLGTDEYIDIEFLRTDAITWEKFRELDGCFNATKNSAKNKKRLTASRNRILIDVIGTYRLNKSATSPAVVAGCFFPTRPRIDITAQGT